MNPLFMLVMGLVVVLILLVVVSWQDYLPYDNQKQNYAKYEGFSDEKKASTTAPTAADKPDASNSSVSVFKNVLSNVMPSSSAENFEPLIEQPKTVQYAPFRDSEIIDKFSQVNVNGQEGVDGCVSSGLSNSGGYICLTPELIQLLKTRGGNAAGCAK